MVYSIERIDSLAQNAKNILDQLGYFNIEIITGDGTFGFLSKAPFDGIIVSAAADACPLPLADQLKMNKQMIIPIGPKGMTQELKRYTKIPSKEVPGYKLISETLEQVVFVPLIGRAKKLVKN